MVNHSLHIENLHVWLKDQHILKEVSFGLEKGKITALIGPNGAGKSTCMKVMAGLIKPQKGLFHYQGKAQNDFRELRNFGGFLIESPAFYNYLTASKNLNMLQKIRDAKKSTDELLKIVGLQHTGKKKISQFSKGMKQRLGIAQALIGDPDFLVLDEPFHGLDIEVKEELISLIRSLAVKEGKSILISSHLLSDLETLADDFVLLNQGKIHYKGSVLGHEEDKNQLRYSFRTPTTGISEAFLAKWKLKRTSVNSISGELSEEESQKVLEELVKTGRVPNQIETMSKLTQKYKEIAE